ncbi:uncharacterized protein GVI51_A02629 [Nakaseomyces glabratus]|uniref:FHA domain-containing protein n=1 Tax=Candida glabrata (strain ATCC 2001 / BCRC 20586 / JCM 3761 / NBRC 0622 / NRRL Y-65 / CBS 138) TaxID=284593 RepID=Q6FY53_CANGA|nr:uncharacterized protein CAGL0A02838g [Nakaseomyces glabratus]KAH7609343.1 FHA domain [Nakaseomyces glabratus]KAH7610216.1 FHA domain [Nakaseomyces glabratus]QHS64506.1 uncharacterized protein GVI51_A02629 [Nakaseomyces glabratus]CAG57782.1 unnamed protein product [Nakaseomyces glabratus]|eukprot:XP_444889.1 uncharacterized protein CAGL0A02838g [[Candida] glabrata]
MWVLRYSYVEETGEVKKVSCCIRQNVQYTIGRSSKNNLVIKNDKSISRQHVSLKWSSSKNCIELTNTGKLTKSSEKYLGSNELITYSADETQIEMLLGVAPVKIILSRIDELFDIPNSLSQFRETLETLGIQISVDNANVNSTSLITVGDFGYRELFAACNDINIYSSGLLTEICNKLVNDHDNFDAEWRSMQSSYHRNLDLEGLLSQFGGIRGKFFFLLYKIDWFIISYLKPFLLKLSVEIHDSIHKNDDLLRLISSKQADEIPIVISNEKIKYLPEDTLQIHSDDIYKFIESGDLYRNAIRYQSMERKPIYDLEDETTNAIIPQKRSLANTSQPTDTSLESTKKKRVRRHKVEPLNSLSFFAGGISPVPGTNNEYNQSKVNGHLDSEISPDSASTTREQKIPGQSHTISTTRMEHALTDDNSEPTIVQRSIAEGISHRDQLIGNDEVVEDQHHLPDRKKRDIHENTMYNNSYNGNKSLYGVENSLTQSNLLQSMGYEKSNNKTELSKKNAGGIMSTEKNLDAQRPNLKSQTLNSLEDNDPKRTLQKRDIDIVKLVQTTKESEVKRLSSTIVKIEDSELTEEAINKLNDLVLVEPVADLIRTKSDISANNTTQQQWKNRKNFKKFVKICPKYKSEQSSIESMSRHIRGSGEILTREFLQTKNVPVDYYNSHHDQNDFVDEINTAPQANKSNSFVHQILPEIGDENENSFSFTRTAIGNGNNNSANEINNSNQQLFVVDDDFEDSQDVGHLLNKADTTEPPQQLQDHEDTMNDGPGSTTPVRNKRNRGKVSVTNGGNRVRSVVKGFTNEDDDDDDDDDEPTFKFSRHR